MTYRLTGRYPLGDLTGRGGERLRFTPSTTVMGDGNIILPAPVEVVLNSDGAFTVDEMVGTDDPAYQPSGWVWTVEERMTGGRAPWSFELTADADLSELASATVPDPYPVTVWGTEAPATGSQGDRVWNSAPVEAGSALAKYVVIGWICTATDTWLPMRALTGN